MNADPAVSRPISGSRNSRRLRVNSKAENVSALSLEIADGPISWSSDEVVVEIAAAGVNRSDVGAAMGLMPHANWPRTPGRDFAGTVVEGPNQYLGLEVWGSSGTLGIGSDGTHGTHLVIAASSVCAKPRTLSFLEAGTVGVPFVTAWKGFERSGFPTPQDYVVVLGASGKVGQAAIQISTMLGARTAGVTRRNSPFDGHSNASLEVLSGPEPEIVARIRDITSGHGADIVYNTIGSPYFDLASRVLAVGGREIFIATLERAVSFDIFEFYRNQHTYVGVNSLSLSTDESVAILASMKEGFESGALKPFPIVSSAIHALADAKEAYRKVWSWTREKVVLVPNHN